MKLWCRVREGVLAALALASVALFTIVVGHFFDAPGVVLAITAVGTTAAVAGNVNEAMKIIFQDPISENFVADSEMLDLYNQDTNVQETTGGRYIELAHYFELPAGVGARKLEGDVIPLPDGPVIRNSRIFLKKIEGTVAMSGDTFRRVRTDAGAFLNWAERALPDLVTRVNHEMDRMLIGFGPGALARVNQAGIGAVTAIPIDSAFGISGGAIGPLTKAWLTMLEGQRIRFGPNIDGTGLRAGGSRQILDVDPDANTITVDAAIDAAVDDNDFIFPSDDATASTQDAGVDREIMGLLGMVDNGDVLATFQGLPRTSYRKWNSIVLDAAAASGGELTEKLLTIADNRVRQRGGGRPNVIITSVEGLVSYWDNLLQYKAINDPRSFTGGKGMLYILLGDRALQLRAVRKMPPQLTFMLETDTLKRWHNAGWEWDDRTGSIWNRTVVTAGPKDEFYATGCIVLQTGCVAPRKNVRIHGLSLADLT